MTHSITRHDIKLVQALALRKYRRQEGLFVAEGNKLVGDTLGAMRCERLYATEEWWRAHGADAEAAGVDTPCLVTDAEMERLSLMQAPQDVLALFHLPHYELRPADLVGRLSVVLDAVQDPGNVGTIIRLCDWFGIDDIVCSPTTADCFAPKVVQATMGAIARVRIHYIDLANHLAALHALHVPVYGTYMDGDDLYHSALTPAGAIVMGNEGRGISPELTPLIDHRLHIPSYPAGATTCESLNVGIATAITVAEFRRRVG